MHLADPIVLRNKLTETQRWPSTTVLGGMIMPIDIQDCDGGIGIIIAFRGMVTDQDLIDSLKKHLSHDNDKFRKYKYILIDNTDLTKMVLTNETVEFIAGQLSGDARVNPDSVVAMVVYVAMTANPDLLNGISVIHELFFNRSCWKRTIFRTRIEAVRWIKEKVKDKFGINDLKFD